jgi:hypothetical protein
VDQASLQGSLQSCPDLGHRQEMPINATLMIMLFPDHPFLLVPRYFLWAGIIDRGTLCLCSFVVIGIQWLTTKPQGHKEIFASNNPFESCPHNLAKSLFISSILKISSVL